MSSASGMPVDVTRFYRYHLVRSASCLFLLSFEIVLSTFVTRDLSLITDCHFQIYFMFPSRTDERPAKRLVPALSICTGPNQKILFFSVCFEKWVISISITHFFNSDSWTTKIVEWSTTRIGGNGNVLVQTSFQKYTRISCVYRAHFQSYTSLF